jgi:hypothetical protein
MRALASCLLLPIAATGLCAQQADSARAGVTRPVPPQQVVAARQLAVDSLSLRPPISPGRAFLYSFILPGAGQARLDRATSGGMFLLIEATALTLLHRSAEDLRIARSFSRDSVPLSFQVDPVTGIVARDANGAPVVSTWSVPRYDRDWVRTRKLHYEDWLAVLFFNHLFAGADAFVAAQLWDVDARLGARQTRFGPSVGATFSFR